MTMPSSREQGQQRAESHSSSLRFYIVWTARFLLPIVYLLSNAKFVNIPSSSPTSSSALQRDASLSNPAISAFPFALLIITHSRANYLSQCIESVFQHYPNTSQVPIIISKDQQDGGHVEVDEVVNSFAKLARAKTIPFYQMAHAFSYEDTNVRAPSVPSFVNQIGYRRITRHYKWALSRIFSSSQNWNAELQQVVILEDDMKIAPDFYSYFSALAPLLQTDPSLYCISAWNDNGIASLSLNASRLYRTDFFPGLGWMLTRNLWNELQPKWPAMFWDDWMRSPEQTLGRQCIRPEISRTSNFGEQGVSDAFQYDSHVSKVILSTQFVDFATMDLSLLHWRTYHHWFFTKFSAAVRLRFSNYLTSRPQDADVIALYPNHRLDAIGKRTGIMIDHRNDLYRTSYHGVIVIPWNGHFAFIVPTHYEPPQGYQLGSSVCC